MVNTNFSQSAWNALLTRSELGACSDSLIDIISCYLTDEDLSTSIQLSASLRNSECSPICQAAFGRLKTEKAYSMLLNYRKIIQLLKSDPYPIESLNGHDSIWERIKLFSGVENSISNSYIKQRNAIEDLWKSIKQFDPSISQLYRLNIAVKKLKDAGNKLTEAYSKAYCFQDSELIDVICHIVSSSFGWLFRLKYNHLHGDASCYFSPVRNYALLGKFSLQATERDEKAKEAMSAVEEDEKAVDSNRFYEVRARFEDIDYRPGPRPQTVILEFYDPISKENAPVCCGIRYIKRSCFHKHELEMHLKTGSIKASTRELELFVKNIMHVVTEILLQNKRCERMLCHTPHSSFLMIPGRHKRQGEDMNSLIKEIISVESLSEEQRASLEIETLKIKKLARMRASFLLEEETLETEMKEKEEQVDVAAELQPQVRNSPYLTRDQRAAEVYFHGGTGLGLGWAEILQTDPILEPGKGILPLEIMEAELLDHNAST